MYSTTHVWLLLLLRFVGIMSPHDRVVGESSFSGLRGSLNTSLDALAKREDQQASFGKVSGTGLLSSFGRLRRGKHQPYPPHSPTPSDPAHGGGGGGGGGKNNNNNTCSSSIESEATRSTREERFIRFAEGDALRARIITMSASSTLRFATIWCG